MMGRGGPAEEKLLGEQFMEKKTSRDKGNCVNRCGGENHGMTLSLDPLIGRTLGEEKGKDQPAKSEARGHRGG